MFTGDFSLEAVYRTSGRLRSDFGIKFETFNLFNNEEKIAVNNTSWCSDANAASDSACGIARANFGTATSRSSFVQPRTFRFTFLFRF